MNLQTFCKPSVELANFLQTFSAFFTTNVEKCAKMCNKKGCKSGIYTKEKALILSKTA